MRYIHHIVTQEDRDITTAETLYTNSSTPKYSMNLLLQIMKGVQYEIVDRETNQIQIVGLSK